MEGVRLSGTPFTAVNGASWLAAHNEAVEVLHHRDHYTAEDATCAMLRRDKIDDAALLGGGRPRRRFLT